MSLHLIIEHKRNLIKYLVPIHSQYIPKNRLFKSYVCRHMYNNGKGKTVMTFIIAHTHTYLCTHPWWQAVVGGGERRVLSVFKKNICRSCAQRRRRSGEMHLSDQLLRGAVFYVQIHCFRFEVTIRNRTLHKESR